MATYQTWTDVRAEAVAAGLLDEAKVAELRRKMLAEVRGYLLKEIRRTLGRKKSELGELAGISRSRVSRIERGDMDHTEIAMLRAYVGGEVEIVAKFGDERITIG